MADVVSQKWLRSVCTVKSSLTTPVRPVAIGIGDERHRDAGLRGRLGQLLRGARIAPSVEQHEADGLRIGQQDLGEMPARHVGKIHAGTEILQIMDELRGMAALGLEARHIDGGATRKPCHAALELAGRGQFVDGHHRGDLALQRECQFAAALAAALVEFPQAVADQPGGVAEIRSAGWPSGP